MRHLNAETLARLVDESPGPEESEHLRSCSRCAAELRALREQSDALASLPDVRPPAGDWRELETRLRDEGLIESEPGERGRSAPDRTWGGDADPGGTRPSPADRSRSSRGFFPRTGWLQAAAALVLFLGGTGVGAVATRSGGSGAPEAGAPTDGAASSVRQVQTVDDAARILRSAEERYVDALLQYRQVVDESDGDVDASSDPASRYAALETLLAASRAAIREAPADPFLNGILASTMAERQDALRRISTADDENWF